MTRAVDAMDELRRWYVGVLVDRTSELEKALDLLTAGGDRHAIATVRTIAHTLRGSGATYGFPDISTAAAAVEDSPEGEVAASTRRLIVALQESAFAEGRAQH